MKQDKLKLAFDQFKNSDENLSLITGGYPGTNDPPTPGGGVDTNGNVVYTERISTKTGLFLLTITDNKDGTYTNRYYNMIGRDVTQGSKTAE